MLTSVCENLLRELQGIPELAVAPDSLLVPPCPPAVARECDGAQWAQNVRFMRVFLEDSDAATVLAAYRTERPYIAYTVGGFVYGIDHEGPHRTTEKTLYRQPISPEELFARAPEGVAFGLWDAFATHIEAALRSMRRFVTEGYSRSIN